MKGRQALDAARHHLAQERGKTMTAIIIEMLEGATK